MDLVTLVAFADEIKLADVVAPFVASESAGAASRSAEDYRTQARGVKRAANEAPSVSSINQPPSSGTAAVSAEDYRPATTRFLTKKSAHESMDRESWKQTAKDLPVVIAGTGLGYGIGRTITERVGRQVAKKIHSTGKRPGWLKHMPMAASVASSLASYSLGRSRKEMAKRRDTARKGK